MSFWLIPSHVATVKYLLQLVQGCFYCYIVVVTMILLHNNAENLGSRCQPWESQHSCWSVKDEVLVSVQCRLDDRTSAPMRMRSAPVTPRDLSLVCEYSLSLFEDRDELERCWIVGAAKMRLCDVLGLSKTTWNDSIAYSNDICLKYSWRFMASRCF